MVLPDAIKRFHQRKQRSEIQRIAGLAWYRLLQRVGSNTRESGIDKLKFNSVIDRMNNTMELKSEIKFFDNSDLSP